MAGKSHRARKVRHAGEFDTLRLAAELLAPKENSGAYAWTLEAIRSARDAQLLGRFRMPVRLAESMRTDSALFVAYLNRLAPQRGLPVRLTPANDTARALRIRDEADALYGPRGIGAHPDQIGAIHGELVNHGIAIGYNVATPREDGSRVDFELRHWPLEWCRWDAQARMLLTRVDDGSGSEFDRTGGITGEVPIVHGDGRWSVFRKHAHAPWKHDAAVLPAALVWADHALGTRDRGRAGTTHGNAKVVGTLPDGIPIDSDEGRAYLELLKIIASVDAPVGIKPFGATLDYITNTSQAWQIFKEIVDGSDRAASRIYLGQDATLGSNGSAPGVDATALFGVRNDIVESDLRCLERGILTGTIEVWAAVNFGDSTLAPHRDYLIPDADEDARRASLAKRTDDFHRAVKESRELGFVVDQPAIAALAGAFGVDAPSLEETGKSAPSIALAPTDIARVVSVNEARASAGLGPVLLVTGAPDPDGRLTVEEYSAKKAAGVAAPALAPAVRASVAKWVNDKHDPGTGQFDDGGGGSSDDSDDDEDEPEDESDGPTNDRKAALAAHTKADALASKHEAKHAQMQPKADALGAQRDEAKANADKSQADLEAIEQEYGYDSKQFDRAQITAEKTDAQYDRLAHRAEAAESTAANAKWEGANARVDANLHRDTAAVLAMDESQRDGAMRKLEETAGEDAEKSAKPMREAAALTAAARERRDKAKGGDEREYDALVDTAERAAARERDYADEYKRALKRQSYWRARRKAAAKASKG